MTIETLSGIREVKVYSFGGIVTSASADLGEAGLDLERYRDLLMVDLYLRENAKSRPSFAPDPGSFKGRLREIPELRGRGKMVHGEILGDGRILLFDYERRDPLTGNAAVKEISAE